MQGRFVYGGTTVTRTIFITGGSKGIGEAVVRMAAGKYNVAFTYNTSKNRALALQEELSHLGGIVALKCDVSDETSVQNAVACAKKRFGKIDILVNNAGISKSGLFTEMTLNEWKSLFEVNVEGVFNVTKCVLPDMLSRHSGNIVNVSSVWGEQGASMEVAYSATKAAVIGFTKALAKEVAPNGVRVNAVAPGAIDTDMMSCYTKKEINELCRDCIPIGRLGAPDEVAEAILYLAEAKYASGCVLTVSGGM